jgi:hypothetical protein
MLSKLQIPIVGGWIPWIFLHGHHMGVIMSDYE